MNRYLKCIGSILLVLSLCCGCGTIEKNSEINTENDSELSAIMDEGNELLKESEGGVAMGFQPADKYEFTYSGSEIEVPLYVGMEGNSKEVEVAAMLFLNGEVQPYAYELDGKISECRRVHYFKLGQDEKIDFTALVTPISGEKGDVLGMQFATVFKSDYLPEPDGNTAFGNCGRMNSTVCVPVTMEASGTHATTGENVETMVTDIPEEIMAMLDGIVTNDTDNPLDYSSYLEIKTENDRNRIYAENGKLNLTLQAYGGKEVAKKITFFVNNEPVKVGDADYVEIKTTSDKMTVFHVCIDVSKYDDICSFYAVAATNGEDYLIQDDITQSGMCLLVNK